MHNYRGVSTRREMAGEATKLGKIPQRSRKPSWQGLEVAEGELLAKRENKKP